MKPFSGVVRQAFSEALALMFPLRCAGCGCPDISVCEDCQSQIPVGKNYRELFVEETDSLPATRIPLWFACEFEEPLVSIVHQFKDRGFTITKKYLAEVLLPLVVPLRTEYPDALWAAPASTARNYRKRGYHPVGVLAKALGIKVHFLLRNVARRKDQSLLGRSERRTNLKNSLLATRDLRGVEVIILDDILTTGATLQECARALRAAGAEVRAALVLAYTPKKLSEDLQQRYVTEEGVWD